MEVHGSLHYVQCLGGRGCAGRKRGQTLFPADDVTVEVDVESMRAVELPPCPCGECAAESLRCAVVHEPQHACRHVRRGIECMTHGRRVRRHTRQDVPPQRAAVW